MVFLWVWKYINDKLNSRFVKWRKLRKPLINYESLQEYQAYEKAYEKNYISIVKKEYLSNYPSIIDIDIYYRSIMFVVILVNYIINHTKFLSNQSYRKFSLKGYGNID